jgi:hypothetical protein
MVVADDAQWLDHSTADVLAFVARRVEHEPINVLVASRDGAESFFDDAGLPELRLDGLDDAAAESLLDLQAPDLASAIREQLLDEARGNPLALVELPVAWDQVRERTLLMAQVPLTSRLEQAFATRIVELPLGPRPHTSQYRTLRSDGRLEKWMNTGWTATPRRAPCGRSSLSR